jgi:hypothetical protein
MAVGPWPYFYAMVVESPDTPRNGNTLKDWPETATPIHSWMDEGDYPIDCWNDYWAGAEGQVIAS